MDDYTKSMNHLPPEILVKIFSLYADTEGTVKLYSILGMVSSKWREIALIPSLWKEVCFSVDDFGGHSNSNEISWLKNKDVLERISLMKTLHFRQCESYDDSTALKQVLKNSWNLENFIYELDMDMQIPPFFLDLSTFCPKVRRIQFYSLSPSPNEDLLLKWIKDYNSNLTMLTVRYLYLENYTLTTFSQRIAEYCPNMTHLDLYPNTSDDLLDLNALQAACPKMKHLILRGIQFTDNDDLSSCFTQLETFYYNAPLDSMSMTGVQDLIRVLRGSKGLKELSVTDVKFDAETMLQLPCECLRKLRLEYYGDKIEELYVILCRWKHSLTELYVSCNEISHQQPVLRYTEEYGKYNLESLTLRWYPTEMSQFRRIIGQCDKLNFLRFDSGDQELTTHAKINEWLNS